MIGLNHIRLNTATICEAVQEYLNKRATVSGFVVVQNMASPANSYEFTVKSQEPLGGNK
jgi:hypothetical protein